MHNVVPLGRWSDLKMVIAIPRSWVWFQSGSCTHKMYILYAVLASAKCINGNEFHILLTNDKTIHLWFLMISSLHEPFFCFLLVKESLFWFICSFYVCSTVLFLLCLMSECLYMHLFNWMKNSRQAHISYKHCSFNSCNEDAGWYDIQR